VKTLIDINFLKNLALDSGKIALSYFGKVEGTEKKDRSIITVADLEIDKFIREKIKEKYPQHLILSEELEKEGAGDDCIWAIDPIDGTASFASGLSVWGISIGVLLENIPRYGVFYIPVTDELYYSDGNFSYRKDKKIKASEEEININSFFAVPSDTHRKVDMKNFPGKTRSMGSTAAHLCYVAGGTAVAAIMKPHIWDIAAGFAILETGGATMKYLDGTEIDFRELYCGDRTKQWCLAVKKEKIDYLRGFIDKAL